MKTTEKKTFLRRFGAWLQELRRARGLAQDKLTEEAGLSRGTVSKLESGTVDPRATTLVSLSRALRVPLPKLLEVEAHSNSNR